MSISRISVRLFFAAVSVLLFSAAAVAGPAQFADSGQALGKSDVQHYNVELGDLDGDGDLDAFVANWRAPNRVYRNVGGGKFVDTGQLLSAEADSVGIALGDVDGDGDLDAFIGNQSSQGGPNYPDQVFLYDGFGIFVDSGQSLGDYFSSGVVLADLDGDKDLDAFVVTQLHGANRVYFNDGAGTFTDSGQFLGSGDSLYVDMGDLDGDGDLDAFVANISGGSKVYLNNGAGFFTATPQIFPNDQGWAVALGDFDGDGDLDAYATGWKDPDYVYLNNGAGIFADTGQRLGSSSSTGVASGDFDGDGDLDAMVVNHANAANLVYLNNGTGTFTDSGQRLGSDQSIWVDLGDLDGDGDLDAFVANDRGPNRVYINDGTSAPTVYNPGNGTLSLPTVLLAGTSRYFQVILQKQAGKGFTFKMASAAAIAPRTATALFDRTNRTLHIPRVSIMGAAAVYAVEMDKLMGYTFEMTSAKKASMLVDPAAALVALSGGR
jgi:hypothetical protein